jgi:hypothetical protein
MVHCRGRHYSVWFLATDELTHRRGLCGLGYALAQVDQVFVEIVKQLQPKEVLMFSDHGNYVMNEQLERSNLEETVRRAGFRLTRRIHHERDVVLPSFGMISFAAVYTRRENISELADVLLDNQRVDFIAYLNEENVIVVENQQGTAEIQCTVDLEHITAVRTPLKFRYLCSKGNDPLGYTSLFAQLQQRRLLDADGYATEDALFTFSVNHRYPHALSRIYDAFFRNKSPGDILVSMKNGYYNGKKILERLVNVHSTHGNLTAESSVGFSLYKGPKNLPSHQMVYELQGFTPKRNPITKGLKALYNKLASSFRKKTWDRRK